MQNLSLYIPDTVGFRVALDDARQLCLFALGDVNVFQRLDDARRVSGGDVTHDDGLTGRRRLAASHLVLGDDAELVRRTFSQVRQRKVRLVDLKQE